MFYRALTIWLPGMVLPNSGLWGPLSLVFHHQGLMSGVGNVAQLCHSLPGVHEALNPFPRIATVLHW